MERFYWLVNAPKILIIGSLSARKADSRISGTVVSLNHLVDDLNERGGRCTVLDSGVVRRGSRGKLWESLCFISKMTKGIYGHDLVSLHLSPNGLSLLGPIVFCFCRLARKPVVLRMFGGMDYLELSLFRRCIADWVVRRMDVFMVQSKSLLCSVLDRGVSSAVWFPTTRPVLERGLENPYKKESRHYVYLGQIKKRKGICELLDAFRILGDGYRLHVYGPFYDDLDESLFCSNPNVEYKGVASPDSVDSVLLNSKALVFPTYLKEEGYSGVVIESFAVGLPVLCSEWKYLPEIVDSSCGILFEPQSVDAIVDAIRVFDRNADLRVKLSRGAFAKRHQFSVESGTDRFLKVCSSVVTQRKGSEGRSICII